MFRTGVLALGAAAAIALAGPTATAQAAPTGGSPTNLKPGCSLLNTQQQSALAGVTPRLVVAGHTSTRTSAFTASMCEVWPKGNPTATSTILMESGPQAPHSCAKFAFGPTVPLAGAPRGSVRALKYGSPACANMRNRYVVISAHSGNWHSLVRPLWQIWTDLALGQAVQHQLAGLHMGAKLTAAATAAGNLAEMPLRGDSSVQFGWRLAGSPYANGAILVERGQFACRHFQSDAANAGGLPGGPAGARWYDSWLYGLPVGMMCVQGSGAPNLYIQVTGKVPLGRAGPFAAALNAVSKQVSGH
jgi:hypothetical protein